MFSMVKLKAFTTDFTEGTESSEYAELTQRSRTLVPANILAVLLPLNWALIRHARIVPNIDCRGREVVLASAFRRALPGSSDRASGLPFT
jgi:hypothetical protein